jgi:hypothetical protein
MLENRCSYTAGAAFKVKLLRTSTLISIIKYMMSLGSMNWIENISLGILHMASYEIMELVIPE